MKITQTLFVNLFQFEWNISEEIWSRGVGGSPQSIWGRLDNGFPFWFGGGGDGNGVGIDGL